jgi:hypothetical protein
MLGEGHMRAVAVAMDAEETVFKLLLTGMTREGSELEKMADKIRSAGAKGITKSELTRAFQGCKSWERDDRLRTLIESGRVHLVTNPTKGRPETRYVHDDYQAADLHEPEGSEG